MQKVRKKADRREIWVDQRWDGKPGIYSLLRTYKGTHKNKGGDKMALASLLVRAKSLGIGAVQALRREVYFLGGF